jgi:hypothetical protein
VTQVVADGTADQGTVGRVTDKEARQWAMLCHAAALLGCVIPFANLVAVYVLWNSKKSLSPFVDEHGKESLNFQITTLIAVLIALPLIFVIIGFFLLFAIGIAYLVLTIIAAIKANDGLPYRYPIAIRLIK